MAVRATTLPAGPSRNGAAALDLAPVTSAKTAGVRHVTDQGPRIPRPRGGGGCFLHDPGGRPPPRPGGERAGAAVHRRRKGETRPPEPLLRAHHPAQPPRGRLRRDAALPLPRQERKTVRRRRPRPTPGPDRKAHPRDPRTPPLPVS